MRSAGWHQHRLTRAHRELELAMPKLGRAAKKERERDVLVGHGPSPRPPIGPVPADGHSGMLEPSAAHLGGRAVLKKGTAFCACSENCAAVSDVGHSEGDHGAARWGPDSVPCVMWK